MQGLMNRCKAMLLSLLSATCALSACHPAEAPVPAATVLVGGWAAVDPADPDVQEAARFAVQKRAVQHQTRLLYKDVLQAERQVVAGIQFKLRLQVVQDKELIEVDVVVWRKLDGSYELVRWAGV